jgi:hypothetical protein
VKRTRPVPAYKARTARRALDLKLARQHTEIEAMHAKLMAQVQQMREAQETHDRAVNAIAAHTKGVSNA